MTPEQIAVLEKQLRSAALNERKAALDELALCSSAIAVPILQNLAQESDFMLRRLAVMGLGNHRTPDSLATLQQVMQREQDANVLAEAANSLFEFGDEAVALLEELFSRNSDWLLRQTILALLIEADRPEVLLRVACEAIHGKDVSVHETGILALNGILKTSLQSEALAILGQLAESPNWRTRWRTATALTGCKTPASQAILSKLQQDEHYRVVAAALEAMSQSHLSGPLSAPQ